MEARTRTRDYERANPILNRSLLDRRRSRTQDFEFYFFSELYKRPVCAGKVKDRIGKVTDLVFKMADPYPEAVGILLDHGWGKPNEFVTWDKVREDRGRRDFRRPRPRTDSHIRRLSISRAGSC